MIAVDFTDSKEIYAKLDEQLSTLDIGTLINNVGICSKFPDYFMELPGGESFCEDIVSCNIVAMTRMSRLVLSQMEKRGRGLIINLSSVSAAFNVQLLSIYGASKVSKIVTSILFYILSMLQKCS